MMQANREKAWVDFRIWCAARGLRSLPAHPWTLAAYVRFCGVRHTPKTITEKLSVIGRVHHLKGYRTPERNPLVLRTLGQLRREKTKAGVRQGPALFRAEDFATPDPAPSPDPAEPTASGRPRRNNPGGLRQRPPLVSRRPRSAG